jgi:hypothetical protein
MQISGEERWLAVNFINILCTRFSYKSAFCQNVTRELKAAQSTWACKMLMKLTPGLHNITNILRATFLLESSLINFYVLCSLVLWFFAKRISVQKQLVKCWWNWLKEGKPRREKWEFEENFFHHFLFGWRKVKFAFFLREIKKVSSKIEMRRLSGKTGSGMIG